MTATFASNWRGPDLMLPCICWTSRSSSSNSRLAHALHRVCLAYPMPFVAEEGRRAATAMVLSIISNRLRRLSAGRSASDERSDMRISGLLAFVVSGLTACSTTSSAGRNSGTRSGPDGLSCATRVVAPSVPAEYAWVKQNYPGARVEMQALSRCGGVPADELYLRTVEGRRVTLYFDISSFFGKGFN